MDRDKEACVTVAEEFRIEGRQEGRQEGAILMLKDLFRDGLISRDVYVQRILLMKSSPKPV